MLVVGGTPTKRPELVHITRLTAAGAEAQIVCLSISRIAAEKCVKCSYFLVRRSIFFFLMYLFGFCFTLGTA